MSRQQGWHKVRRRLWHGTWHRVGVAAALLAALGMGLLWRLQGPTPAAVAVRGASPAASAPPTLEGVPSGGPLTVEAWQAQRRAPGAGAQAVGNLRALQSVVLRSAIEGRIVKLGFQDGQLVHKGQLLVQLDNSLLSANVRQAEALARAASGQLQRAQALVAQFGDPAADHEKYQAFQAALLAMDNAQAAAGVATAEVNRARGLLKRQRVLAPFDGVAHLGSAEVGDPVSEGAELLSLEDRSSLWVDVRFERGEVPRLRAGQILPLSVDALPGQPFEVRVQAMEDQGDASGSVWLVHTRVLRPVPAMRPGLVARVGLDPQSVQPASAASVPALAPRG